MRLLISALLLAALAGPASALSTASQSTDGGVTIRANVSSGVVLDPGDRVSFQYQSSRDAALVVFDIDTQGYVTLLSDEPVQVRARETGDIPNDGSELFAEGEPGVEFVFAVAVPEAGAIDSQAFESLRGGNRRINGDPFIAANMIAAELVRDISQQSVFIGYAYFYVSERVEYPCYLCGTCDGAAGDDECAGSRIVQNFDRGVSLRYPLARGYDVVESGSANAIDESSPGVAMPLEDDDVEVNFYPYGSEVHYADPVALNLQYSWGWYDPFYWSYPYCYPYYYSPWSFSIGFGWGWGWGGGYYCSGWYDPWYGCGGYPYYPYDGSGSYPGTVTKFKSKYKSGSDATTLAQNRSYAMKKDGDLRVASKSVRTTTTAKSAYRSKTSFAGGSKAMSGQRVKTSVSGTRSITRGTWAKGKNGSVLYKGSRSGKSSMYRSNSGAGKTVKERAGYRRSTGGAVQPQRGGNTRMKSGPATRSKSSWSAPSTRSAPRASATRSAPRMSSGYKGSNSSPAYRGGGGWGGGSRSSGSMGGGTRGGGMRGGGMKGGGRGR